VFFTLFFLPVIFVVLIVIVTPTIAIVFVLRGTYFVMIFYFVFGITNTFVHVFLNIAVLAISFVLRVRSFAHITVDLVLIVLVIIETN
jgi:hypothetical protein